MRCKCSTHRLECSWPYYPPYESVKAKFDKIAMAEQNPCDVHFSLMTVATIKVNNLSEIKTKESEIKPGTDIVKFSSDQDALQNPKWFNGDIGPIGLEMDEPSRPSSPCSCMCSNNCRSSHCDKSKNATDTSVNSKINNESNKDHQNIKCEIPSIFLTNTNGSSNGSTLDCNQDINSISTAPSNLNKDENVSGVTDDYMSDDCTSSSYYVPSTASVALSEDCEVVKSPGPPTRPPRTARLRREKTQSEADASLSTISAVSYKSLRSQSDPSAHFTTVVKPRALRPSCGAINIHNDNDEPGVNGESAMERQNVLQEEQNDQRSSAFKEHFEHSRTDARARSLFYSRSLEISSPSHDDPVFLENGSVVASSQFVENLNVNASRSRARSMNDVLETRTPFAQKACNEDDTGNVLQQNGESSQSTSKLYDEKLETGISINQENEHRSCKRGSNEANEENLEPIHMTLEEVKGNSCFNVTATDLLDQSSPEEESKKSPCRQFFRVYFRPRKSKKCSSVKSKDNFNHEPLYHRHSFPVTMKAAISSLFGLKRNSPSKKKSQITNGAVACSSEPSIETNESVSKSSVDVVDADSSVKPSPNTSPFTNRALPPLPVDENGLLHEPTVCVREDDDSSSLSALSTLSDNYISTHSRTRSMDYAASIEKVKDCGWYWGPISGETAEKLLANEPDGAFVVRDSSDEHYIFSLTFKLNGWVRHVRIEHDHGNFSFGCQQKFRSNTIVDFIENAVEHSRSGRYLFFLHRRPVLGPMRVQLLHPVSRFKQVQSLQHMCRFVILKSVRRDLIDSLPLPRALRDYLNTPHYYSEELSHLSTLATAAMTGSGNITATAATSRNNSGTEPS